jgi:hypothetical protein
MCPLFLPNQKLAEQEFLVIEHEWAYSIINVACSVLLSLRRIILEKLIVTQLVKRVPDFNATPTFIPALTTARHTERRGHMCGLLFRRREILGLYLLPVTRCNKIFCDRPQFLH